MSIVWEFDHIENKHTLYHGKDCMEKFCESLRERGKNINDSEKKKMLPLTKEELKLHQDANVCYICEKRILKQLSKSMNYWKVRDHYHYTGKYRGAAHSIYNLRFNMRNEIAVVVHNGPNYDYHFLIKELANEFEGKFECLGKMQKSTKFFRSNRKKSYRNR